MAMRAFEKAMGDTEASEDLQDDERAMGIAEVERAVPFVQRWTLTVQFYQCDSIETYYTIEGIRGRLMHLARTDPFPLSIHITTEE